MNHQRLPDYPQHPEPKEATGAEFDREQRPRASPAALAWVGAAFLVGIFAIAWAAVMFQQQQALPTEQIAVQPQGR